MMQNLYILTLTYNGIDKLAKLKESLLPNLTDLNWTWLIKDNASTDNTVDVASAWDQNNKKQINVFKYKDNKQNFSEGCNYLFNQASPKDDDYIMLLNNDVVFNDSKSIKKMLGIIKNKNVGVVGARLLFTDSNKLQHAGVVFEKPHALPCHFRVREENDNNSEKNRIFQVVTGAVLLTKAEYYRNAFKNSNGVCGMDENYRWAFDDVDLNLSIGINMEKHVVYCGQTNISHESSATLKKTPVNKLFMNHNINYMLQKWKGRYKIDKELYAKNSDYNLWGI